MLDPSTLVEAHAIGARVACSSDVGQVAANGRKHEVVAKVVGVVGYTVALNCCATCIASGMRAHATGHWKEAMPQRMHHHLLLALAIPPADWHFTCLISVIHGAETDVGDGRARPGFTAHVNARREGPLATHCVPPEGAAAVGIPQEELAVWCPATAARAPAQAEREGEH